MDIAQQIMDLEPNMRSGTLRTFGCWFGRPMDNYHQSESAAFDGEKLTVSFNEGETLEVWNPSALEVEGSTIRIPKATKVKWSWYYYGRPKTAENLLFYEYIAKGGEVTSSTNSPWPTNPSNHEAAVELC